jgi:pimeloyl-ACP methyl ester carboxylesterase
MMHTTSSPRIAYSSEGEAGPRVLLIMGFGMTGGIWRPQIDGLRQDHRVAFYDHLGLGESDPLRVVPTMVSMAHDVLRVLDALGWQDAHVVGVSMGGMIAQELALTAPSRLRSLTLIATHAGGFRAITPRPEGLARFTQANLGGSRGRLAALKRLLYTSDYLRTIDVERIDARVTAMAGKRAPTGTIMGHLAAVTLHRTRRRLAQIRLPTLIVRPAQDILVHPRNSDILARHIPGARVVHFEDAGHGVTFQCAAALNAEIRRHIADSEQRRQGSQTQGTD